jgi:hypothetical protein
MKSVQDVFSRLQEKRRQVSLIRKKYKEELTTSVEYQRIREDIDRLREKKKRYEASVRSQGGANFERIDELSLAIRQGTQLLSDLALTTLLKGDRVEVRDAEQDADYEPVFTVRFRKASH